MVLKYLGEGSSGSLNSLIKEAFLQGHVVDQEQYLKGAYHHNLKPVTIERCSRATYFRRKKQSFQKGETAKIVIEVVSDDVYPPGYLKTIYIPCNSKFEKILNSKPRVFDIELPYLEYNSQEEDKILVVKAQALKNILGPVCKLTLFDLSFDVLFNFSIKYSPRLNRNSILYAGEELVLDLLRIKYPEEKAKKVKELKYLCSEANEQLKSRKAIELYYELKEHWRESKRELSHDLIDWIGTVISPELGALLHLELRLKQAEKELEEGEVEFVFDDLRVMRRYRYRKEFSKGRHAIMLIPLILYNGGTDYGIFIMVYNGWYEPPKTYIVRGYRSINKTWVDPSLPTVGAKVNRIKIAKMLDR